ncbi:MAG: SAM-dependent methyltransferase [Candidatus Hydrogenedentes bacterium]|nr:SAM-dependent methyltransferase [Candidatus Hydrogenedentota bacterium]
MPNTALIRGPALHAGILIISAVGIAYQIVLMRVFTIGQWHHFAYMVISIAMLGFGLSGTLLALAKSRLRGRETGLLCWSTLLLAVSLVACYALSQRIPFETLQLVTLQGQWRNLVALYVLLTLPFFFVSTCIMCGFMLAPRAVGRLYFVNMFGSGLGALAVIVLLRYLHPATLPYGFAVVVALVFSLLVWRRRFGVVLGISAAAVSLVPILTGWIQPIRISEYKGLSYALQLPDAGIVAEAVSPLSHITAVSSKQIRETPGQISNYPMDDLGPLPEQIGLYFDAGAVSPVNRFEGDLDSVAYLDYVTSAVAYRVAPERPHVAVIGSGGGTDVLGALAHNASHVTAVEVDPAVFDMVRGPLAEFSGQLYSRDDLSPVIAEGRGFLQSSDERFDLIMLPVQGSFLASTAGAHAVSESYLYTTEALSIYIDRLTPGGVLSMTCWLDTPPRTALKLFATAVEACRRSGIEHPENHLVFIRTWNVATVLVSRAPLDEGAIAAVREFCDARWFDLCHLPGLREEEANRFVLLEQPTYFRFAQEVLFGDPERAYRESIFYVRPATDDRPYFSRFVKWRTLPGLLRQFGANWLPYMEWGYLALVATLVQGIAVSLILILAPLVLFARTKTSPKARRWVLIYFAALGFAFMFLEIAFIQRFMLFLAYPMYSVTVVLTAFLVFSGLGSLYAHRAMQRGRNPIVTTVAAIASLSLVYLFLLGSLFTFGSGWPDAGRIGSSIMLLAPIAFAMGIPFPLGLQYVSTHHEPLLPWAWGINGCASVVGALSASLCAVHLGFRAVVLIAVAAYIVAAFAYVRMASARSRLLTPAK